MSKKLFITGTGTDVGKTFVTGLMIKKLNEKEKKSAYFKAAMSGNERGTDGNLIPGDAIFVKTISGIVQPLSEMCPYVYEAAISPHLASRIEKIPIRMDIVRQGFVALCQKYDYVTMEGSGGILCPLSFDEVKLQLEDVIKELNLSCLLIADAGLGTINAVTLTAAYMRSNNIPVKGIIFNRFRPGDILHEDNLKMCEAMTELKVLACVKEGDMELDISFDLLESLYE